MSAMEMMMLIFFGLPLVLLVCAFVVLATWMQVNEEQTQQRKLQNA